MSDRYDKSLSRKPLAEDMAARREDMTARRGEAQPAYDEDPLMELARIVSGNESFDDILGARGAQQAQAQSRPAAPPLRAAPRDTSFDLESELLNDLQSSFDPAPRPAPRVVPNPAPQAAAPARPAVRPAAPAPREPAIPRDDFNHMPLRPTQPTAAQPSARREPPAFERDPYRGESPAVPEFIRSRAPEPAPARAPAPSVPPQSVPPQSDYDDDYYQDDEVQDAYDDQDYLEEDGYEEDAGFEPERPRRSRKMLYALASVLAVILIGGGAVYALRDRAASITGSGAPKIIAADEGPTKIQPAVQPTTEADNSQQNKLIYDRANPDTATPDQLVLPDDGPVDENAPSAESAGSREISRIILPGGPGDQASTPAAPGAATSTDTGAADDGADAGPRKVRTVVVKPDGTIVSSEAAPRGAAPAGNSTVADATPPAAAPAPSAPVASAPAATSPAAAPAPDATSPPPAAAASEPAATEPLPGTEPGAKPQKDSSQLAAPKPAAPKPAEAPAATVSVPSSGGFVVQVTSQRSEEQAAAAYRNLQKKFPSVLGNHPPDIARADLGAKGVYYRARVGPMATRDEATTFCEALRAAGGDCIVQKN